MSRAFVKEDDQAGAGPLPDRPISPHRNLVKRRGLRLIEDRIARYRSELARASVAADRDAIGRASRELRSWTARLGSTELVETDPNAQHVFFMSNNWAMGYKFWEEDKFEKPSQGEWYLGADYQEYLRPDVPNGAFVAWDVPNRKELWRLESDQPFWAGALVTESGIVFTGDNHGYALALDAKSGKILWHFPTGSPIAGRSPIIARTRSRGRLADRVPPRDG